MDQLAWLPAHPNLSAAIKAVREQTRGAERLDRVAHLAGFRRDFLATERLDGLTNDPSAAVGLNEQRALGLTPLRLAVLASHTVNHLAPGIRVAGLQRRMVLRVYVAPFGQYRQALLTDDPGLAAFAPQAVLIALNSWNFRFYLPLDASEGEVASAVELQVDELRALWRRAKERYNSQVIQQTLLPLEPPLFGSYEALVPAAPAAITERLNARIRAAAREEGVLLLDLAWLGSRGSLIQVTDPMLWHHAKQLISPLYAPLYGDLLARILAAALGLARKCLVLDLDNTLWGGVVGDDGVEHLRLGQGSAEGEAYLAFQRYVALLGRRGVILAICSKNDMAIAEAGFRHPEMAITREEIAVFIANWTDKASNLRAISKALAIGLDGLVFVDDNPAEREIVRRELPEIAVPELPDDVARYPSLLSDAGYFEAASFTGEDAARGRSYALNVHRLAQLDRATDLDGYLRSLEMIMTARPIDRVDLPRVVQLINKTNQFNLTTKRYTEPEMASLLSSPDAIGLSFRLRDRFGDSGLISVILARPDHDWPSGHLLIDTWLMSCRVLGRKVETAALHALIAEAKRRQATDLIGAYIPTPRNALVADHYTNLAFEPCSHSAASPAEARFWRRKVIGDALPCSLIQLEIAQ